MKRSVLRLASERPMALAVVLGVVLFVANLIVLPRFVASGQLTPTLGTLAPFALAGMASTPAFLSGGGGIDLSIAPLMGLVNIVLVTKLLGTPFGNPVLAVPILLALGAGVGALNGVLITRLRFPPVIATLGMFFVISGLNLELVPNPVTTSTHWTADLAGSVGPIAGAVLTVGAPLLLWFVLRRTAFVDSLLAVGDHDATAFSAGVKVNTIRIAAYALGGLVAAVGGIALTGLIRSADATTFNNYILMALAAVALGGSNLAGGRGGLLASAVGAACIFLLNNLLAGLQVSGQLIQVAYGGALLLAVVLGGLLFNRPTVAA
jgi:ribose transport system permease protein